MTDCDLVFTKPYLEKTPLEDVPLKPDELLAPTRFVTIPGTAMDPSSEVRPKCLSNSLFIVRHLTTKPSPSTL